MSTLTRLRTEPVTTRPATASLLGLGEAAPTPLAQAGTPAAVAASAGEVTDWFDLAAALGPRGYKYLPQLSQLALAAGRGAVDGLDLDPGRTPTAGRSVWVGTGASLGSVHTPIDTLLRERGSELLSPLGAPYFSINLAAARFCSEFLAHGGATTFTTPGTGGLDALAGAIRAVGLGRGGPEAVSVALAVEVTPPQGEGGPRRSETGAVALALAGPGRPGTAQLAVRRGGWEPATAAADLRALAAGFAGELVTLLAPEARSLDDGLDAAARDAVVGPGCYVPLAVVADLATGDAPRVLLVAAPGGRAAAVLVTPPTGEKVTPPTGEKVTPPTGEKEESS